MKINYQNSIVICFDLHDTLLDSTDAWIKAFKEITNGDKALSDKMITEYLSGGWKREIVKKYGFTYEDLKDIYINYVRPMENVKKFCDEMKQHHRVFVITNATRKRAEEDIKLLNINFDKIYSRDDGIKPDKEYIVRIMQDNSIDYMIMVGNETERDIFDLETTKTIIVDKAMTFENLIDKYSDIVAEIKSVYLQNK